MVSIVYAHDGGSTYGPNIYDLLFLRHMVRNNKVLFLTFSRSRVYVPEGVAVSRIPEPYAKPLGKKDWTEGLRMYVFFLLRSLLISLRIRQIKPDILFGCMATKYGFYAALSGFRPFVLIVWGSDILISPKRFLFFRFMAKYALKRANAVIVDSDVQEKAAIQLGCNPNKILKFPWFDIKTVHTTVPKEEVRKELGWLQNPIVISARSHEPIYGVQYLIDAIPHIVEKVPETRFLIIGKGQLSENFRKTVRELGVETHVKFLGSVPHELLISYLNAADLNVSMSISDGASASLLEAMTLGVPSVVTDIPGNKEWVKNDYNGRLISKTDSQVIAESIVQLLRDENLRHRLGQTAIETVKTKVNWNRNAQSISDLVSRLVAESPRKNVH